MELKSILLSLLCLGQLNAMTPLPIDEVVNAFKQANNQNGSQHVDYQINDINNQQLDNKLPNNQQIGNQIDDQKAINNAIKNVLYSNVLERFNNSADWLINKLKSKNYKVNFERLEEDKQNRFGLIHNLCYHKDSVDEIIEKFDNMPWSFLPVYPDESLEDSKKSKLNNQLFLLTDINSNYLSSYISENKDHVVFRFNCAYELQNSESKNDKQNLDTLLLYASALELDSMTSDIMSSNSINNTSTLLVKQHISGPVPYLLKYFAKVDHTDMEKFIDFIDENYTQQICYQFLSYIITTNYNNNDICNSNFANFIFHKFSNLTSFNSFFTQFKKLLK